MEYLGTKTTQTNIKCTNCPFSGTSKPTNLYLPATVTVTYSNNKATYTTNKITMPFLGKSDWKTNDGKHIPN